ncbi:DNA mismatch repair endonuclease MutL [Moellerella wisconsensis]|uniref:DNA mismatch repair endonuclease MutL n=1 Tax=Moellerella wisconsensis TaxID=158849 RepID=UPI00240FD428|nr:DNA mismatch repair endonuclease MutL [Moellerella wisconsensis]
MSIKILSPQLANQIAAGEVVERPASVVKELIENSLDAGATRIDIDIERGGEKLIRIRDNGCGITKDELTLALARHATSKIATLDDLEAIISMGFRGEALASISSVSRLTLTSKTETQPEAWQSYAEGRDMSVTIKPAAHPTGTTVEVLDLFYNTPARRKFLRTEKTEFGHIDEIVRRIALARPDVAIYLNHNGKLIRQYRSAKDKPQQERRLASICGANFMQQALEIAWEHGDLAINGWVTLPVGAPVPDIQYCYVNGRMMRDRLINHAIRQAYEGQLHGDQQPAYVLYLTVDPHQVDVNVHPAKHEVRFHQARLVHDFIYQGVKTALMQAATSGEFDSFSSVAPEVKNRTSAGQNCFSATSAPSAASLTFRSPKNTPSNQSTLVGKPSSENKLSSFSGNNHAVEVKSKDYRVAEPRPTRLEEPQVDSAKHRSFIDKEPYDKKNGQLYQQLMSIPVAESDKKVLFPARKPLNLHAVTSTEVAKNDKNYTFGKILTIYAKNFALIESSLGIGLLSLSQAEYLLKMAQLSADGDKLKPQPLLIPLKLSLNPDEIEVFQRFKDELVRFGIEATISHGKVTIHAVSLPLRTQNLSQLLIGLLNFLTQQAAVTNLQITEWLARTIVQDNSENNWTLAQAVQVLADVERLCPHWVHQPPSTLLQLIDLTSVVVTLTHE